MRGIFAAVIASLFMHAAASAGAGALQPKTDGFYLHWNRDHTERGPRPMYPLSADEAAVLDSYWLDYEDGWLVSVKFFHAGKPSPFGDYGAHELVRQKTAEGISEHYFDAEGSRIQNASGVWETRYVGNMGGFWAVRQTVGQDGALVDAGGYAELRVRRDDKGRRIYEVRYRAAGEQVAEHNGFATATFGFNEHDFATHRLNLDAAGNRIDGDLGFAEVRFRFDTQGNFLSEEVYKADGTPKNFPSGFADIRFSELDRLGRPHRVDVKTETGEPFGNMPVIRRTYLPSGARASNRYFQLDGTPGMDGRGAHEVRYHYDEMGKRTHVTRHDAEGIEIKPE